MKDLPTIIVLGSSSTGKSALIDRLFAISKNENDSRKTYEPTAGKSVRSMLRRNSNVTGRRDGNRPRFFRQRRLVQRSRRAPRGSLRVDDRSSFLSRPSSLAMRRKRSRRCGGYDRLFRSVIVRHVGRCVSLRRLAGHKTSQYSKQVIAR